MFNIHWWHHVTNVELRRKAAISSLEYILYQRQLRWVGQVVRMPTNRLPRQLLYGELRQGQRTVGRPKKRFADHLKCILKWCGIPVASFENLAADRDVWKSTCRTGLDAWEAASTQAAEERRQRRHAAAAAPPASHGPQCQLCGRICASEFGLRSHLRVHSKK